MLTIEQVTWAKQQDVLSHIRRRVFIEEQQVPEELEWDGRDETAIHLLAYVDEQAVGNLRLLSDGHIGRMAVIPEYRKQGIGTKLMQQIMQIAYEEGLHHVHLDAQVEAVPFYERLDFVAEGDIFMDAGIPHQHMSRSLRSS